MVYYRHNNYVTLNMKRGGCRMKFKDYLILPVIAMYVLYTSCAYLPKPAEKMELAKAPAAVVTAYACNSGSYDLCGGCEEIEKQLTSGKFVNSENPNDWYVFKSSGKSAEYFGNKVFKGKWQLEANGTVSVYDQSCKEYFHFNLQTDFYGRITGFQFNNITYTHFD